MTTEAFGRSCSSRCSKRRSCSAGPSTSTTRPAEEFSTQPVQRHFRGQAVDERAEADSLHGSAQRDAQALRRGFCRNRHGKLSRVPLQLRF